jgi:cyclase
MAKASKNIRLIARLDIKGENLIKGIHLEGLRIIGSPNEYAKKYYEQGADEIIYMDIVASLYGRSNLLDIVSRTAHDVFVPLTVGGGVRTVNDVEDLLRAGADKVAINTAAVKNPDLITEVSRKFGSQCMVLSIEAMRHEENKWEIYTDCGREKTGIDAIEWARNAAKLGAGELLVTSINQEGTRKGFDTQLINSIAKSVNIPIIASGGYGEPEHLNDVVESGADGVAFADALHFNRVTFDEIRRIGNTFNISTRMP